MRILWFRIPWQVQRFFWFLVVCSLVWFYNNIALITLAVLGIIFLSLFIWGLYQFFNFDNYLDTDYRKIIWIVLIVLSLPFGYLSWYIMYSYDESNKYLQEQSISWLVEIWKFAVSGRRFTASNILKAVESNLNDTMKEEVAKSMIDNLAKNTNWKSNIPTIEPNVTVQSWVLNLNPVVK